MSYLYDSLNSDNAKAVTGWIERFSTCLFCSRAMSNLGELTRKMRYSIALDMPPSQEADEEAVTVWRCPYCGWWAAKSPYLNTGGHIMAEVGYGALRAFDPADVAAPIEASRAHLMLRPEDALKLHPQRLEDIVGSIFRDFGYRTRVTAYRADGGIDVYLDSDQGLVGVQVKRTKNPIEIEQVSSLTGALLVNDCTSGIFVTTSRFRRGARQVAGKARVRGLPVELYDGQRLLKALEIAQLFDPEDLGNPWMRCVFKEYYKEH
ncbi:MAG: restriction endonuclease [Mesorhizobium sp.]|nr:MAG: restriction endonuclease [Mesorhizobium sp.]